MLFPKLTNIGIRRAILEGDVDRALKFTNVYYPHVLQENEPVYFKLRCRKFVEMVRKAAQLNMAAEAEENGNAQDMDIDANEDGYEWDDAPVTQTESEVLDLERDMLEYGQALQAEYAEDSRKEVGKALDEIWSLIAYRNPLKEPQVSHLLARKGRVVVAEELNSAILCKHASRGARPFTNELQLPSASRHARHWKNCTRRPVYSWKT